MPPMDPVCALKGPRLSALLCAVIPLPAAAPVFAQHGAGPADPPGHHQRIVHRFDFDERASGNLEDVPKYWESFRSSGFAYFTRGAFDFDVGRGAPPSFHLSSAGRNVAYHYAGPETVVRPNSEYRIEGFVRSDRLRHARAALSAHFLDRDHRPIVGTMVRSRYVGGPRESDKWIRVELFLPAAPLEARTIGLTAWVLQEPFWNTPETSHRHIPRADVHGGAWFDDIVIHALPRVALSTNRPGNILAGDGPLGLRVVLADHEDAGLTGRLSILDAAENVVQTRHVAVVLEESADPIEIPLDELGPGLYRAELDVYAGKEQVASRTLTFARTAPRVHPPGAGERSFGVTVDPGNRSDPDSELALLLHQGARSAKLPVWSGLPEPELNANMQRARRAEYQELLKAGFSLTGVFHGPPSAIVRRGGPYPLPLLEMLAGDPSVWKEHLAAVVAPHASVFRWWQIGPDSVHQPPSVGELRAAVVPLREAMKQFITLPQFAVPQTTRFGPDAETPSVEQISLAVGDELALDELSDPIARYRALMIHSVTAYVEPLPESNYRRLPRLAHWAQRVVTARHQGADTVFVPQTWRTRETAHGWISEPVEEYVVLRTIADLVGNAVPSGDLHIAPGVRGLVFDRAESAVLVAWDPAAPLEGRPYPFQLGMADRQFDLWGRSTPLTRDERDRQVVYLSPLPTFVPSVDPWLNRLRSSFAIEPYYVESGSELVRHTITLFNSRNTAVSGRIQLKPPPSWTVTPRILRFNLMPRQSGRLKVEVHYPHNEPAGVQEILAQIELLGQPYYFEVPLSVEIGLTGLEVWGDALLVGGDLVLRHSVTNRTSETLHFRGTANVPGRARQYRPFSNLAPGRIQAVEYHFARGAELSGLRVRLDLREMNDGPRIHTLALRVP